MKITSDEMKIEQPYYASNKTSNDGESMSEILFVKVKVNRMKATISEQAKLVETQFLSIEDLKKEQGISSETMEELGSLVVTSSSIDRPRNLNTGLRIAGHRQQNQTIRTGMFGRTLSALVEPQQRMSLD